MGMLLVVLVLVVLIATVPISRCVIRSGGTQPARVEPRLLYGYQRFKVCDKGPLAGANWSFKPTPSARPYSGTRQ